jgi:Uma2 family endonuclease
MRVARMVKPRQKRWTRAEYYRMLGAGLFRGQRVELIEGVIFQMPPMKTPHAAALELGRVALDRAFGRGHWIRTQLPLHFGPRSEPEPDLAVVPGGPRDFADHPTTALLIVEISDATLSYDRRRKGSLYARAGIADYWVVNLNRGQLEVYHRPIPDPSRRYGYGYSSADVLGPNDEAVPLAAPQARVRVADLLP